LHAVAPIYDTSHDIRREILTKVSLHSRWLCHCVLTKLGDDVSVFTRVQRTSPDSEPMMTFDESDNKIVIGLNGKLMDSLARSLRSGLHA
jgi:hypothetical protein